MFKDINLYNGHFSFKMNLYSAYVDHLPMGYVLKIDWIMSAVRLYLRPFAPSVCGLISAYRGIKHNL